MRAVIVALVLLLASPAAAGGWEFDAGIVRSWVFTPVNTAPRDINGVLLDVTSASPPSIWVHPVTTEPFFLDPSANATLVGQHGVYGGGPYESGWWRGSAETCAAGHPVGWVITENGGAGAGIVVVDCDNTTSAHGGTSIKFTANGGGGPKYAISAGTCQTNWIGQDVTLIAYGITKSGTAECKLQIYEYDNADCTAWLAGPVVWGPGDPGANWTDLKGTHAAAGWNAATSSWKPQIVCEDNGGAYTANFDFAQAYQQPSTWDTDSGCAVDAPADAVCSLQDITTTPPEHMSAWTFDATVRSPIDGAVATPVRYILVVPGTAGNNNKISLSWASDTLTCTVYDHSGAAKTSTVAAAGNADTDYSVKMSKSTDGRVECCWDGTCDATPATDAITDGIGSEMIFGSDGTTGGEIWIDCGEDEDRCKLRRGVR